MNAEDIVEQWLAYTTLSEQERENSVYFEAWDVLFQLSIDQPKVALDLIVEIFENAVSSEQIAELAAGPFEELLVHAEELPLIKDKEMEKALAELAKFVWTKRMPPVNSKWISKLRGF